MRWELNDMPRRLDEQPATVELLVATLGDLYPDPGEAEEDPTAT
jgi:hypothetical protein